MTHARKARRWLLMPLVLIATACGTNTLRVEYAGNVAAQGKAAAIASRNFLGRVEAARQETNIELIVADPACARSGNLMIVRGRPDLSRTRASGWLCVPEGAQVGAADQELSRAPLTEDLRPTLGLIDAVASYAAALTEIVDAEFSDPAQEITEALETARAFQGLFLAVTGAASGPVPAADDSRVTAVTGFVSFLEELNREKTQVRRLRELLAQHPTGAEPIIAQLQSHLRIWEISRAGDVTLRSNLLGTLMANIVRAEPPASAAQRREALVSFYQRQSAAEASAELSPALNNLLLTLLEADRDMRRVLREDPDLTKEEAARVASINRARLLRALERVTALITAFRGV